jgi:hypothetical protein
VHQLNVVLAAQVAEALRVAGDRGRRSTRQGPHRRVRVAVAGASTAVRS